MNTRRSSEGWTSWILQKEKKKMNKKAEYEKKN